jgi:hypothetical protein
MGSIRAVAKYLNMKESSLTAGFAVPATASFSTFVLFPISQVIS